MGGAFLAQEYWVVLWRPAAGTTAEDVAAHVDAHLDWMLELERDGHVLASGPLLEGRLDGSDVRPGSGLTVLRAPDAEAAAALADQDPFVKAGLRGFDVVRWRLMEGALTLRVSFGTSTYTVD